MTFIMLCYNCALYPLYNMFLCMWDQCSKILFFQEETVVDDVTYESDSTREPPNSDYHNITINIADDNEDEEL